MGRGGLRRRGTVGINDPFGLRLQSLSDGPHGTAYVGRHTRPDRGASFFLPPPLKNEQKNFEGLGHGLL